MSEREKFVVTFVIDADGADGGWNPAPILDAIRDQDMEAIRSLTIERATSGEQDDE